MTLLSRRAVLIAGVGAPVAILTACSDETAEKERQQDDPVRSEALTSETSLVAAYRGAIAAQPSLASRLTPILDQHLAHIAALSEGAVSTPAVPTAEVSYSSPESGSASPSGSDSTGGSTSPSGATSPSQASVDLVPALRERERAAAEQRVRQCVGAGSASLARTLSLIGASEAQHVVELAP